MADLITPPTGNDTNGFFELFRYVNNTATDGLFMPMILGIVWVIVFMATRAYSAARGFTYASFMCMILGIPLSIMGLLSVKYMYIAMIFTAIGAAWVKLAD